MLLVNFKTSSTCFVLLVLLCSATFLIKAQVFVEGRYKNIGFKKSNSPLITVDLKGHSERNPMKFGEKISVDIDMKKDGCWSDFPNGSGKMWRLRIYSANSFSLNIVCDRFRLPVGAELYIKGEYSKIGAFTAQVNNKASLHFATVPLKGRFLDIEYYAPDDVKEEAEFHIKSVVHGFRPRYDDGTEKSVTGEQENDRQEMNHGGPSSPSSTLTQSRHSSSTCLINAPACPQAMPWLDQVRSTVILMTETEFFCSGFLINNANQDGRQLIITANHCIGHLKNLHDVIVGFNYYSNDCKLPSQVAREFFQDSNFQAAHGVKLLASSQDADVALLELEEKIPVEYNVYMAGWSLENHPPILGTCIHHPLGAPKKISLSDERVQPALYSNRTTHVNEWQVVWAEGATQPGSSGSPLWNEERLVLGHLHGGASSCSYQGGRDVFIALSTSMAHGLAEFINPNNQLQKLPGGNLVDIQRSFINIPSTLKSKALLPLTYINKEL